MRKEIRKHFVKDVECQIEIEIMSKTKDIFDWLDEYVENLEYEWFDGSDDSFEIIYKDGTVEYIDNSYDGHKIKRRNIKSMLYNNPCTYMVYGDYEINEYGVAHAI